VNDFWHGWVSILTISCLVLTVLVLWSSGRNQRKDLTEETTGHEYDGITEIDNPLPRWWVFLFIILLVFSVFYLCLYPGMGNWKGLLNWSSSSELARTQKKHNYRFAPQFERYYNNSFDELINNPKVMQIGERIFINNCSVCHAIDAGGRFGFPNLRDNDWLFGGSPEQIEQTILHGRKGQMPPWKDMLSEKQIQQVAFYVRGLSNLTTKATATDLEQGKKIFHENCALCHNPDGTGNHLLGAPNLTNNIWLYGSSQIQVEYTIRNGRQGVMPAWQDVLGKHKVRIVAAYIYRLNQDAEDQGITNKKSEVE
jgi:cytochrome c oxidase cbb3-type subunit 3